MHECPDCGATWPKTTRNARKRCDPCLRERRREVARRYYNADHGKASERAARYRAQNLDKCRAATRDFMARQRASNPDHLADLKRRSRYGLAPGQYEALLAAQGGRCQICRTPADQLARALYVDHDHNCCSGRKCCGKCIRGLLCMNCNTALGMLGDDLTVLISAADYLLSFAVKAVA